MGTPAGTRPPDSAWIEPSGGVSPRPEGC